MEKKYYRNIQSYITLYMKRLLSGNTVRLKNLEKTHKRLNFSLHQLAASKKIDVDGVIYSLARLPDVISDFNTIIMTPSMEMLIERIGMKDLSPARSRARRRESYYSKSKLYFTLRSTSDVHDIVPILTLFQIEWNKMRSRLKGKYIESVDDIKQFLELEDAEIEKFVDLFGDDTIDWFRKVADTPKNIVVSLITKNPAHYDFTAMRWAQTIMDRLEEKELLERDVYLISSNTHSVVNMLGGYAFYKEKDLISFVKRKGDKLLKDELKKFKTKTAKASYENFLYYALKKYLGAHENENHQHHHNKKKKTAFEADSGIYYIKDHTVEHLQTQIIDLARVCKKSIDPRLKKHYKKSEKIIINIDYPFGEEAYFALKMLMRMLGKQLKGLYITGKAGGLMGDVRDIHIPDKIYDETLQLTYTIKNGLNKQLINHRFGSVHKRQLGGCIHSTVLNNHADLLVYKDAGISYIEMEAGYFLKALHEGLGGRLAKSNVDLSKLDLDIGLLYYISDTPLIMGKTLGAGEMSYLGLDSTYACVLAVIGRILRH